MSSCLVSVFGCCSRKKRVAPCESFTHALYTQNVATQTPVPVLCSPESAPKLKLSDKVFHKGMIMVRNGDSFQSQSSDENANAKFRKFTVSPRRQQQDANVFVNRHRTQKETLNIPFVFKGNSMPKLNPVTPRRTTKSNFSLPSIKKQVMRPFGEDCGEMELGSDRQS